MTTNNDTELFDGILWLVERLEGKVPGNYDDPKVLSWLREKFEAAQSGGRLFVPEGREEDVFGLFIDELYGFGPLQVLLDDDSVTEIMVNGPYLTYVEQNGRMVKSDVTFAHNAHVERIIRKITDPLGRVIDAENPMVDARMPDGSRVNAVVPPCAIDGPAVTIRKYAKEPLGVQDLINFGSMSEDMAKFLEACVVSKLNIVVAGGSSSGKTTLLNVLSSFIPDGERIVTIEDAAELSLQQRHVIRAETKKKANREDTEVTTRDLVKNALRMRPDRIIVGECRGPETLDMLQAMNTGHDGSLTTTHANTPRDVISRLETLILMAGMDLPLPVVRQQIVSAVHLIVQQARLRDGTRKVMNITEIIGIEGDTVIVQDIFRFEERERDDEGHINGEFVPGGYRPRFEEDLKNHGFDFPPEMFLPSSVRERRVREQEAKQQAQQPRQQRQQQQPDKKGGLFGRTKR
ncbi:MAG: CpaF family protein [Ardenticatenaceae bacterium]|nr:CpaF family protein [Ardenticatenaceae bacterium]